MRTPTGTIAILAMLLATRATAAELVVRIDDGRGAGVADAVVMVSPRSGAGQAQAHAPERRTIDQKNLAYVPYLEVFRPGDEVVFHNSDRTRHHVYSFSPVKAFEFVLASHESSPPQTLDKLGAVAVGCNIHDQMIAWLYVSDAPWLARTGTGGDVRFRHVPPGDYRVRVWHPRLDARGETVDRRVTLHDAASRSLDIALRLRPDARAQPDRERADY